MSKQLEAARNQALINKATKKVEQEYQQKLNKLKGTCLNQSNEIKQLKKQIINLKRSKSHQNNGSNQQQNVINQQQSEINRLKSELTSYLMPINLIRKLKNIIDAASIDLIDEINYKLSLIWCKLCLN